MADMEKRFWGGKGLVRADKRGFLRSSAGYSGKIAAERRDGPEPGCQACKTRVSAKTRGSIQPACVSAACAAW